MISMLDDDQCWDAVLRRDADQDGRFVYAVRSTRIYCRPSCPARRPVRANATFFTTPGDAARAGYRACLRCHPAGDTPVAAHAELAARVCALIDAAADTAPTLDTLAAAVHLSPYHLQRSFRRTMGITPHQYAARQRLERLKHELRGGAQVTHAMLDAGYGSLSAGYAQTGRELGMTPAAYRAGAMTEQIVWALLACEYGLLLVASTPRGICAVRLGDDSAALAAELRAEFPAATIVRDDTGIAAAHAQQINEHLAGRAPHIDLPLDLRATAFQLQVWAALRAIPYGTTHSYSQVARAIGQPTAARAVARACATNPVALVIPCHRVVTAAGGLSGYRWGVARKRALIEREAAYAAAVPAAAVPV